MSTHRSPRRAALAGMTALALLAPACGDDEQSAGTATAAPGDTTPSDTTPGQTTPSDTTPGQTTPGQTTASDTTPSEPAPTEVTSSTSCFGITMADILATIGDGVATRYETELAPPGD